MAEGLLNHRNASSKSNQVPIEVESYIGSTVITWPTNNSSAQQSIFTSKGTDIVYGEVGDIIIFTCTLDEDYTLNSQRVEITSASEKYKVNFTQSERTDQITYGISIDMSNTDPESAVTYIDDCANFTPLSVDLDTGVCDYGTWRTELIDFFGVKPCVYTRESGRTEYLNPDNYKYTASGELTSNVLVYINDELFGEYEFQIQDGSNNIMVEFKKCWYKYSVSGNILTFEVANYDRSSDGFVTDAFKTDYGTTTDCDYFYYGAYTFGFFDRTPNTINSLSGQEPNTSGMSYNDFVDCLKQNYSSTNMWIESIYKRMYILGLSMLLTKTRDIQSAAGYGNVTGSSALYSGTMDTKGLFWGSKDGSSGVKFLGIENLWGNIFCYMSGLETDSSGNVKIYKPNNTDILTTVNTGVTIGSTVYPTTVGVYVNGAIILPTGSQSGSTSLGWCDGYYLANKSGYIPLVAGVYGSNSSTNGKYYGPFSCSFSSPTSGIPQISARVVAT